MKKIFLASITGAIALFSNATTIGSKSVQAGQTAQSQKKYDPKEQTDKMAKSLDLSEEQKTKVLAILTDVSQKKEALRTKMGDTAKNSADWKTLDQDKETRLKTVLTDEQYKKHMQMKDDMKMKDNMNNSK